MKKKGKAGKKEPSPRRMALLALNVEVERIVKQAIGTRSFASAGLVSHWTDIIGQEDAPHCLPLSLRFPKGTHKEGTLTVKCQGGYALELQHRQVEFLERINAYFGYRAIARLKITQGAVFAEKKRKIALTALSAAEIQALEGKLSGVSDSALKERLARFGQAILQRNKIRQAQ